MIRIDAHQHYWQPKRGDYDWMPMDNAILARAYAPLDLAPHLAAFDIGKTVLVQAAATVCETEYLLGIADASDSVAGVVGWVDFEQPRHFEHLKRLSAHPKFLGVRPMIQDIADVDWMLRDDVQWGFRAIRDLDLTLDALGFPIHLQNFLTILTRYPEMRVVLDHCMKPCIRDHARGPRVFRDWADGIARIAGDTGAYCKFSGLVTEAGDGWSIDVIRPYADHILQCFGPERLMWGSDWPVCRLQASYARWHQTAMALTDHLGHAGQVRIFGGTAAEFYRLHR
jgi:L-fucono-1,5-lactonase